MIEIKFEDGETHSINPEHVIRASFYPTDTIERKRVVFILHTTTNKYGDLEWRGEKACQARDQYNSQKSEEKTRMLKK